MLHEVPNRTPEGARQMGDGAVGHHHEVEARDHGGGVGEIVEMRAEGRDEACEGAVQLGRRPAFCRL